MELDRHARLERVLAELRRRFGDWVVFRLGQARPRLGERVIPTGSLGLDLATGIGGIPRGRLTELVGPVTSGKSALAAHLLASGQQRGGFVAWIDASHACDFALLRRCGVDLADLFLVVPTSTREAMDIACLLVASEGLDALVISAANHLVVGPGGDARAFEEGLRRLVAELAHAPTAVLFVVHGGTLWAPLWRQVGRNAARALAHAATLRLAFRPVQLVTHPSGDLLGLRLQVQVIKNKLAPPHGLAELEVWQDRGIHLAVELLDLGLAHGLVERRAAGYCFGATWLGRGRMGAIQALEEDAALAASLRNGLLRALSPGFPHAEEVARG